jgi:rifampin ADP-ribosylating transferase
VSDRLHERMTPHPTPFEVHESGNLLHGTKANLAVGDVLVAGRPSNFDAGRVMNHVYVAATLDAAVWGAELASLGHHVVHSQTKLLDHAAASPSSMN